MRIPFKLREGSKTIAKEWARARVCLSLVCTKIGRTHGFRISAAQTYEFPKEDIDTLRRQLAETVPAAQASIPELIKAMRLVTRSSQTEYAKLCGVAPRVLKRIEAGELHVQVESLEKLMKPFGYAIGVVRRD